MKNIKLHRNSQKRFYGDDKIYFITTVTNQRFPFFKEDLFCELLVENLRICKGLKNFKLYAFIIIQNHVHLLLKPGNDFNISQIMQNLKRTVSLQINQIMFLNNEGENINEENINEGENIYSRLHLYSRLRWNNKIIELHKKFIAKYGNKKYVFPPFKWQQSFHDHVIRNEKDFLKHLNYIVFNCVKHELCADETKYKWSSLNSEFGDFVDDWFK